MTVYVLNVDYKYPDVDGHGYTLGVYSSKKKAKEALEKSNRKSSIIWGLVPKVHIG